LEWHTVNTIYAVNSCVAIWRLVVSSRLVFLNLFSYFILDLWNPVVSLLQEVRNISIYILLLLNIN